MAQRLQKIIAEAGLMSRRAAEDAIRAGRVQLNGRTAQLGDRAEQWDDLLLDGRPLPQSEEKRYYILNKPRGYVCSLRDEKGRRSVRELLPPEAGRVYPVGRLDIMSEGLLIMTNDGEFSLRLTHPSWGQQKCYRVEARGADPESSLRRLRDVFILDGVRVQALSVESIRQDQDSLVLEICIQEGRNRQIRRMCDASGLRVTRLIRVREGPIELGSLKCGAFRQLTQDEIHSVMDQKSHE